MDREQSHHTRVLFMGSGPFAVTPLERLAGACTLVGVVTQPDRPFGRGRGVRRGEVATLADCLGLSVLQPVALRDSDVIAGLEALVPDVIVVASYGRILPRSVLELPSRGCLNLHPSLLPRHRGASPLAWTILEGDESAGVSVMEMVARMDAGPILAQRSVPLSPEDTTASLTQRLSLANVELLLEVLSGWLSGRLPAAPQEESEATYTRILTKEDGRIDWTLPASRLEREVRAYNPWPVSFTTYNGGTLRVWGARVESDRGSSHAGTAVDVSSDGILVACGEEALRLVTVQPEGRRIMAGHDFALGQPAILGAVLGG